MLDASKVLAIKHRLLDLQLTVAELARRINRKRAHTSMVIAGTSANPQMRRLIAAELGRSYSDVWGEADPGTDRLTPGRKPLTPVKERRAPVRGRSRAHPESPTTTRSL